MKIEICTTCSGSGEIMENVGTHQSEYEYYDCPKCNGTGRMIRKRYTCLVPFGTDKDIIYQIDNKFREIFQTADTVVNSPQFSPDNGSSLKAFHTLISFD